jgi:predicted amidohydrolase YtcJ
MDVRLISKLVRVSAALLLILALLPGAGWTSNATGMPKDALMPERLEMLTPENMPSGVELNAVCSGNNGTDVNIPDSSGGCGGWVSSYVGTGGCGTCASNSVISSVVVSFVIRHTCPSDLEVVLSNAYPVQVTLWNRDGLCDPDDIMVTNRVLNDFNGQAVPQAWHLWARDCTRFDAGYIDYFSITVNYAPAVPPAPALLTPADGSLTCDSTPALCWSAVAGATSYWLQVDNNSDFSSPMIIWRVEGLTCWSPSAMYPGEYFWRVASCNDTCGQGPLSPSQSFTIVEGPGAPALYSPTNGSSACNAMPTFCWIGLSGATSYNLQVDNNPDFSSPLIDTTTTGVCYHSPSSLPPGNVYWRVSASNICGPSAWSPVWQYTVSCPTGTPTTTRTATRRPTPTATRTPTRGHSPAARWLYLPLVLKRATFYGSDEFDGPALIPAWHWVNEDRSAWSLTARPGFLRLLTTRVGINYANVRNLLLQAAPAGDFEVRTRLIFAPTHEFQDTGLRLYADPQNLVEIVRGYCDPAYPPCVGDGVFFEGRVGGKLVPLSVAPVSGPEIHLRLARHGRVCSAFYSADGLDWRLLGEYTLPEGAALPWVGIAAVNDLQDSRAPADFDYVRLSAPLPDAIYYNGVILTMEGDAQAQALSTLGERILEVGSDAALLSRRAPWTRLVNLGGKTLMPGFVDGHSHTLRWPERQGRTLDEAIQLCLSYGLTSVTEMSGDDESLDALFAAEEEGRLRLRVNVFPSYDAPYLDEEGHWVYLGTWFEEHGPIRDPERRLRIPGVKIFTDGAGGVPGRGCAAMTDPFSNIAQDPTFWDFCFHANGDLYLSQTELNAAVAMLQGKGYSVSFHAMGDRAIETALNAVESALAGESNDLYRHQIQHSTLLRPDQAQRYQRLGMLAEVGSGLGTCDQDYYLERLGAQRYTWAANRWALFGLGVHAYSAQDFAWDSNPYTAEAAQRFSRPRMIWALVTRQQWRPDGPPCQPAPWVTTWPVTVRQALRWLTIEAAYAVGQENYLGSLKPGKFADMVILSANPLNVPVEALPDLRVLTTIVGGKVEYTAP